MEYSTDLFDAAWADRFLGCMETLLEHAAAAPGTPVADLPMGTGDLGRWREDGSLQLTPAAKVDRASPPAPEWSAVSSAAGRVEPRNPIEATLARIWGDLLDTQAPVGVRDNLFALGGHSLTATRFVASRRRHLRRETARLPGLR